MDAVLHWKKKMSKLVTELGSQWPSMSVQLEKEKQKFLEEYGGINYIDECYVEFAKMLSTLFKQPKQFFHLYPWISKNERLVEHLSKSFDLDMQLWHRIQRKSYRHGSVPATAVMEIDRALSSDDLSIQCLFDPEIFERNSDLAKKLKTKFSIASGSKILLELAQHDKIRNKRGVPDVFRHDPMTIMEFDGLTVHPGFLSKPHPQHGVPLENTHRTTWANMPFEFRQFFNKCKEEDFQELIVFENIRLRTLEQEELEVHCMQRVTVINPDGSKREEFCKNRLASCQAYCVEHLSAGADGNDIIYDMVRKLTANENVYTFGFCRDMRITVPIPENSQFIHHHASMIDMETNFERDCKVLENLIRTLENFHSINPNMTNFPEEELVRKFGPPTPFNSWKLFVVGLRDKLKNLGYRSGKSWANVVGLLRRLVSTQGHSKVSKKLLAPTGDKFDRSWPGYKIRKHDQNAACYNVTAPSDGRNIFAINEGLHYGPRTRVDQQELPLYLVEPDQLAKCEAAGVMFVSIASRIMFLNHKKINSGVQDAVNRNDPNMNNGFKFVFSSLVNVTDNNKPAEHSLKDGAFTAGGKHLSKSIVDRWIVDLNQRGTMKKGNRTKVVRGKRRVAPREEETQSPETTRARLAELEAPQIQALMIKMTNEFAEKFNVQVVFLSSGRATITRLSKDCLNWSTGIDQDLMESPVFKKLFEEKKKLIDMVKTPLLLLNPEPTSDGTAFDHDVEITAKDERNYHAQMDSRFQAHIDGQQVNTFHLQLTSKTTII